MTYTKPPDPKTPPIHRLLREIPALLANPPWSATVPPVVAGRSGGQRSVLVLPGFLANDTFTVRLRHTLAAAGYEPHSWRLGRNRGISVALMDALIGRLDAITRPVSLVGWSLGGLYAREMAKRRPDAVDRVVTLGSPFSGDPRRNHAWRAYEWVNGHSIDAPPVPVNLAEKPPVPTFALWSDKDGIVAPAAACGLPGEADHHVRVACRHVDFVSAPAALTAILDVLEAPVPKRLSQ